MSGERSEELVDFLGNVLRFHYIKRHHWFRDGQQENDAEHSWHLAMLVLVLAPELEPDADINKMLKMAIIHDLPEIYAGDTFAYDTEARKDKKEREVIAAEKLLRELPDDRRKEFAEIIKEYSEKTTVEARLVTALDKLQPLLANLEANGEGWKRKKLTWKVIDDLKRPYMAFNPKLTKLYEDIMARADKILSKINTAQ